MFGPYFAPLVVVPVALALLALLVGFAFLVTSGRDAGRVRSGLRSMKEREELARRAAQLRTRELDAHRTYVRVVPVLQAGELARPIILPDWRR